MSKNTSAQDLAHQIETLIQNFIAETRLTVTATVEKALAPTTVGPPTRVPRSHAARRKMAPKRSPEDLKTLADKLYEAVCANPGETMIVLARAVGARAAALQVPAARLKKEGRIRAVGQKQLTRYFPMVRNSSKSG